MDLCDSCSTHNPTFSCSECQTLFCSYKCFSLSKSHQRICASRARIKSSLAFKSRSTPDSISISQRLLEYAELSTASSFLSHLMLSADDYLAGNQGAVSTTLEYWGLTEGVYEEWEDWMMAEAGWIMANYELINDQELSKLAQKGWGVVSDMLKSNIRAHKKRMLSEIKEEDN